MLQPPSTAKPAAVPVPRPRTTPPRPTPKVAPSPSAPRSGPPPLPQRELARQTAADPARAPIGAAALAVAPLPPRAPAVTIDASDWIEEDEPVDVDMDGLTRSEPPPLVAPRPRARALKSIALVGALGALCAVAAALLFTRSFASSLGTQAAAAVSAATQGIGGRANAGTDEPRVLSAGLTKNLLAKVNQPSPRAAEPTPAKPKLRTAARPSVKNAKASSAKKKVSRPARPAKKKPTDA